MRITTGSMLLIRLLPLVALAVGCGPTTPHPHLVIGFDERTEYVGLAFGAGPLVQFAGAPTTTTTLPR